MTQPQMAPICLVENHNEQLSVNQEAIEILDKISQPVVVVAIVGWSHTGKSYLMNCLAGQNHVSGFPLGSTVQSQTKGIWMWCVPHPTKPEHCPLPSHIFQGDPKNDLWIFALSVLLSSTFVYNSMNTINHQALEQLHYVTELTELIRAKSSPNPHGIKNSTEFVSFFPDFVWTVWDFMLELKLNGEDITSDDYLENALKLIPGLGTLVTTYVDAINSGAVPCLDDAVTTLAQRENSVAVQKAASHYSEQMAQRLRLPTDTLQELLDVHAHSFKDENQQFLKKLVELLREKNGLFLLKNEEASDKYCQEELDRLSKDLMDNISRFSVPGGHRLYMDMREKIEHDYWQVPRKGVKASEVFQNFLQSQAIVESSILQADTALTAGQKAIAEERTKKEAAEKEQDLLRQKQKEQQEYMEAQEKRNKENIEQLRRKLEQEREQLIKDHNMMLEKLMKEQKTFCEEGYKKQAEEMSGEIHQLGHNIKEMKQNGDSLVESILRSCFSLILPPSESEKAIN
uniref:GB1/RHD3-type G domain-containing protein n=1 Tax=Mus spicilegus TaxID=10103 RepID=A0A8C6HP35_MUSSI